MAECKRDKLKVLVCVDTGPQSDWAFDCKYTLNSVRGPCLAEKKRKEKRDLFIHECESRITNSLLSAYLLIKVFILFPLVGYMISNYHLIGKEMS